MPKNVQISRQLHSFHMLLVVVVLLLLSHFSHVRLCATPEKAAHQAPPSLGFSRQEYWSGLPFPSPMHGSEKWKWSCSVVSGLFVTPWTAAYQAPLSMGFARQEDWSGVPLPSPSQQTRWQETRIWSLKIPWKRKRQPTQYSCLGNPTARGTWQATVHGMAESDTSEYTCTGTEPWSWHESTKS